VATANDVIEQCAHLETEFSLDQRAHAKSEFPAWRRSPSEELANTVTHGFGLVLAIVGSQLMGSVLVSNTSRWMMTGVVLYLISLVAVYAMSTLSHCATSVKWKSMFRQLDQGFIYLLIVATYTPFSIAYLHGPVWTALLVGMWGVALHGFVTKVFFARRIESVSVASYVMLGWVPIVAVPTLIREAPNGAFNLIIAGGICYTVGTLFLIYDERVRHFHAAWHLCVIAGSACHFFSMLVFVLGA
jgi:hemolysin III